MQKFLLIISAGILVLNSNFALADQWEHAPPSFQITPKIRAVPIHILDYKLEIRIHSSAQVSERSAKAVATIRFQTREDGHPFFLMPRPGFILRDEINSYGAFDYQTSPEHIVETEPSEVPVAPSNTTVKVLEKNFKAGEYSMNIYFDLSSEVSFHDRGVALGFFMANLKPSHHLERYAPANFEFDQFPLTLDVSVTGDTDAHWLFANGRVETPYPGKWNIRYPKYFNSSAIYFHLTDRKLQVKTDDFKGQKKFFPITVYGESGTPIDEALKKAKELIQSYETDFGEYMHSSLVIYLLPKNISSDVVGMEYSGATMTKIEGLSHEVLHSWFGRGVMPANGDAGWIDEAMTTWSDQGYPKEDFFPKNQLSGFSLYKLDTPRESYSGGASLLSALDLFLTGKTTVKKIMKSWYETNRLKTIATPDFENFITKASGVDVHECFEISVYSKIEPYNAKNCLIPEKLAKMISQNARCENIQAESPRVGHPRALTDEELNLVR